MAAKSVRTVTLPSGTKVPALGQGTWRMAEDARRRKDEIAALRAGLDLGMTLIDTAEMYASGEAETLTAEAIKGRRDEVFLVSKVLPENATKRDTLAACERSLKRLSTDRIDLYLLHWRGSAPLAGTVEAFDELMRAGKIRAWGVSNFDRADLEELWELAGGKACATNQVLYNLSRRGIEHDLVPWCAKHRIPVMAYSPVEQGRLLRHRELQTIAQRHKATPAQVALAWTLRHDGVISIPKAGSVAHVKENFGALHVKLTAEDFAALDRAFPPPRGPKALEMI